MHQFRFMLIMGLLWLFKIEGSFAQLPWEMIAGKYDQGSLLSEKSENIPNYSISKDLELVTNDPKQTDSALKSISLYRWSNEQWELLSEDSITKLTTSVDKMEKGFYKSLLAGTEGDPNIGTACYFLVEPNWKKELLVFCQNTKREIETQLRAHEISASIVVSHFDNLQEQIAKSKYLTEEILSRLSLSFKSKRQFEKDKTPDFSKGLNKLRFKRFEGADYTNIVVHIPNDYDPAQKWPVYVYMDPALWTANKYGGLGKYSSKAIFHPGMIDMWWHSIPSHGEQLYLDLKWEEFLYVKKVMGELLNIDDDRFYLFGECWNGMSAMAVAVNYPDIWAHCTVAGGNSYRHLIGNTKNIKMTYAVDHPKSAERVADCDFCSKCFTYFGCTNCSYSPSGLKDKLTENREEVVDHSPYEVQLTLERLNNPTSFWLTILGREDENYIASIKASVDGQNIVLTRKNVDAYQLDLKLAPLDHTQPMTLIENGKKTNIDPQEVFSYRDSKYEHAKYIKNSNLHGPIYDVFTDAYTVLYTAGCNVKQTNQIAAIAKQIAGTGPCLPEEKLSDQIIRNHNLVIAGKVGTCEILKKISNELPVQFEGDSIAFDGQSAGGNVGAMMIYPNPLNPEKYITFILAGSDLVLKNLTNIWKNEISKAKVDVAIFKVESNNQCNFIRFEKFNTIWGWHKYWNESLASVSKEHPKWQWRQWIGHVIRTQMNADVMISEEVFETDEISNYQSITPRILNRALKDQWIIKIKLKGSELKTLLMQSVARKPAVDNRKGNNRPPDEAKDPIVDGVSFVKGMSMEEDGSLHISDIKVDQYYTVSMSHKLLNGSRLGMTLNDYEIVGDGYLLQMLFEYLENRESLGLDSELGKMKLIIL